MIFLKKIIPLLFFVSFISNNIDGMEQEKYLPTQKPKTAKKNLHRPPPLSPPNKDTTQTRGAKEFFSSAPHSRQNSAHPKQESKTEDESPVTLSKIFAKLCAIEKEVKDIKKNQKEILAQQTHTQSCVSALIHLQEAAALRPQKKSYRTNKVHPTQPSVNKETAQMLSVHIIPGCSPADSISDCSPLES